MMGDGSYISKKATALPPFFTYLSPAGKRYVLAGGGYLLNGHTHVPMIKDFGDFTYVNCGSIAIPKENSAHSYIVFDGGRFEFKTLE